MGFKSYIQNINTPGIAFVFGRTNPPTIGHQENFDELGKYAKKNRMDGVIYTSFSQNEKKNPLKPADKIYFLNKMAPKNVSVSNDTSLKNAFQILEDLVKNKGYKRIAFLVGSDRENDFQSMKKYADEWSNGEAHLDIIVTGQRKQGVSGTDMRNFAKNGDLEGFSKFAPKTLKKDDVLELFKKTQAGLSKS